MALATTDLCDAHEDKLAAGTLRVLPPGMISYGKKKAFAGSVVTLKVFEDNSLVRKLLEEPGAGSGHVLVVDGGGSLRCALLGGNLAELAVQNGWQGIIVNGCIRDQEEINACDLGVRALATHPVKSFKRMQGEKSVPVVIAGVRICPGEWCYADSDGILFSATPLAPLAPL